MSNMSNIYDTALSIVIVFGLTIIPFFVFMKPIIFINERFICKKQTKSLKKIVKKTDEKIKIGVLTNELPPIIYGGVSTWVLNFMKMFEEDPRYESVPIFLAYQDSAPEDFPEKYPGIRIIRSENDVYDAFKDIDICVNNLWIALNTIKQIKSLFPDMPLLSVCHSLIKMEHLTNLGSVYTNNYFEQEITFEHSDFVILISKAEKKYYTKFGYSNYKATPVVIYNMYSPKYDDKEVFENYDNNNLGYIGRHVPRKRPELTLLSMLELKIPNTKVVNMGVKFDGKDCYWQKLMKKYEDRLKVIEFTCDKKKKQEYPEAKDAKNNPLKVDDLIKDEVETQSIPLIGKRCPKSYKINKLTNMCDYNHLKKNSSTKQTQKIKKTKKVKVDSKSKNTGKLPRCPNGSRRNKKTGLCESN